MEMNIPILMSILPLIPSKNLNSLRRCAILTCFQNQEYRFTIPKFLTRLVEKREEEHRQLQSVMHFTQTLNYMYITKVIFHKRKYSKLTANSWLISGNG